jgi:hypothetical protein
MSRTPVESDVCNPGYNLPGYPCGAAQMKMGETANNQDRGSLTSTIEVREAPSRWIMATRVGFLGPDNYDPEAGNWWIAMLANCLRLIAYV